MESSARYPKPSDIGGTLIRRVIATFKGKKVSLPLKGKILIAVSGGVDSMAMAHLIARYGRKIVSPENITLLHFDHAWRPESGTTEREAIHDFADTHGLQFLPIDLESPSENKLDQNRENDARKKRNAVYQKLAGAQKKYRFVLTAHHRDDVVETLLWRFFRGEFMHQREGILFKDRMMLRPMLQVTKEELYAYARAEQVPFFEDPTNQDPDQYRSWARTRLIPMIEEHFPAAREVISRYSKAK